MIRIALVEDALQYRNQLRDYIGQYAAASGQEIEVTQFSDGDEIALLRSQGNEERNGVLEQLFRRGVHQIKLPPHPTKGDVAAILKAHGLEFPEKSMTVQVKRVTEQPYEILRSLARENGLKSITERIRYARKLGGGVVSWESFTAAHLYILAQRMATSDWE